MNRETLGFIGLGMMGGPMAMNLCRAGYEVVVCDTSPAAVAPLTAAGAKAAASAAEVAAKADTVLASLPTTEAVRAVCLGPEGLLRGKRMRRYAELSTMGTALVKEVAGRFAAAGVGYLDAPVSGGERGARAGTLAIMAAGTPETFAALKPALQVIGEQIFHVGPEPGMAQIVKVANNILSMTNTIITSEAMVLGAKAGIDPAVMLEVINASSGRNKATEDKFPTFVLPRNFKSARTEIVHKDVSLGLEEAQRHGVPMWVANAVLQFISFAMTQGHADEPSIGLVRIIEEWAGAEVRGRDTGKAAAKP
jgi:3-hydroxyisobutyrate dehydrogenase-like beta-hydroxyacid dehydrogenase